MDEIMKAPGTGLTPLSMLAEEARVYSENIIMNTLNLGRVLTEAKQQVKHGEWGDWVAIHAGMSVRSAQTFMQVYSRFGGKPLLPWWTRASFTRCLRFQKERKIRSSPSMTSAR